MEVAAFYIHRQSLRIHTIIFYANRQVRLLSDADDFDTVDSGPGGYTSWVPDCTSFFIEFRYRMDGSMDDRRLDCTLLHKLHVMWLPMHMYLGTIKNYHRHRPPHVLIIIPRLDHMCVAVSRPLALGDASDEQADVERSLNQTQGSGSGHGHRSTSTQAFRASPYSDNASGSNTLALEVLTLQRPQTNAENALMPSDWYERILRENHALATHSLQRR